MNGTLKSGADESFKISAPGAISVAIVIGGEFTQLSKEGDVFEGKAAIKGNLVQVAAKFPGSESYFVLLKYKVS